MNGFGIVLLHTFTIRRLLDSNVLVKFFVSRILYKNAFTGVTRILLQGTGMSKRAVLLLVTLTASSLLMVSFASVLAQSKPSVPEFTLEVVALRRHNKPKQTQAQLSRWQ